MSFIYQSFENKVFFGLSAQDALVKAGNGKVLKVFVIAAERNQNLVHFIENHPNFRLVSHFTEEAQHVPQDLVNKAIQYLPKDETDVLIAIGGGSAIGLAKALALQFHIPIWAIPTTYAGSEMTNIYGISNEGKKVVGRDNAVLPKVVIYDHTLTSSLPAKIAIKSATNALAHLIEAVYALDSNPVSYMQSIIGIRHILDGYQHFLSDRKIGSEANKDFLLGTYLGGKSLCELPMSLHHKLAHIVGGNYNLDHASTHTVLLAFVLDYQWPYLSDSIQEDLTRVFGSERPALSLLNNLVESGIETSLESIGFKESAISEVVAEVCQLNFDSPAPIEPGLIEAMLKRAFKGEL